MSGYKKPTGLQLAKILYYYGLDSSTGVETEFKIICPFHGDINPSMKINLTEGSFYCFGCGKTGNAIDFVKYAETELNSLQAEIKYYKILKTDKVKNIKYNSDKIIKRKQNTKGQENDIAYNYYYGLKKVDWSQINKRSDRDEIEVYRYMSGRGFKKSILSQAGARVTTNDNYKIIFPMLDNGIFKGYVCRTMDKEVEKKRKYLYNKGFSRRDTLVGNYAEANTVILVEGFMDRLKLLQFGVKNVVAILGWKITSDQIQKLKDAGVKTIISMLDNDTPGRKGTEYLKQFFKVIEFKYEENIKDPGMMTRISFLRMKRDTARID